MIYMVRAAAALVRVFSFFMCFLPYKEVSHSPLCKVGGYKPAASARTPAHAAPGILEVEFMETIKGSDVMDAPSQKVKPAPLTY
jgi:hypothetical protein